MRLFNQLCLILKYTFIICSFRRTDQLLHHGNYVKGSSNLLWMVRRCGNCYLPVPIRAFGSSFQILATYRCAISYIYVYMHVYTNAITDRIVYDASSTAIPRVPTSIARSHEKDRRSIIRGAAGNNNFTAAKGRKSKGGNNANDGKRKSKGDSMTYLSP